MGTATKISQGQNMFLHTVKTVDWLVNNTTVSVFDPIKFEGYQREINEAHCKKIVQYLITDFFLPTPVICACDDSYSESVTLRIVDGQHRIKAFEHLKDRNIDRYNEIKDYQVSVIVMDNVKLKLEIDTFITINKMSKPVDTSLAYVLKNRLNRDKRSDNLTISKLDYLSVELAIRINNNNELWDNKISFSGSPKSKGPEVISLNAFVKATRRLIGQLNRKSIINIEWENELDIYSCLDNIEQVLDSLWGAVVIKWPYLFKGDYGQLKIIQGSIGYSSICKFIANKIKNLDDGDVYQIKKSQSINQEIYNWIMDIKLDESVWFPENRFSKLSSESGYNIIVSELEKSTINY